MITTTSPNGRRFWGTISPSMTAAALAEWARQQEDAGLFGTFAVQWCKGEYGPPWISLAAAATTTQRLQLASGIAQTFVRSPFETAMAAIDLDRISNGRFTLGLGTSIRSWCEGTFGVPYDNPFERMREAVEIIRLVTSKGHTHDLSSFSGRYYEFDWREFEPIIEPIRPTIPIWVAAVQGALIRLSVEIADGIIGHPIWSPRWASTTVPRNIKEGLAACGKQRSDIHVCYWFWVTPNEDVKQSLEDARRIVALYAGSERYTTYFTYHGFGDAAIRLREAVKQSGPEIASKYVSDEMAKTFVVTGTPQDVAKQIEPMWEYADSLCLLPPILTADPDQIAQYYFTIANIFYG